MRDSQPTRLSDRASVVGDLPSRLSAELNAISVHYGPTALRLSIGLVFLWFGVLKFFPSVSPAEDIAVKTLTALTLGAIPGDVLLLGLALFETALGACFVAGIYPRIVLPLLFAHMLGTGLPFLFFPAQLYNHNLFMPTFLGQLPEEQVQGPVASGRHRGFGQAPTLQRGASIVPGWIHRSIVAGAFGAKLDDVAVRIAKVDRVDHAVIRRAAALDPAFSAFREHRFEDLGGDFQCEVQVVVVLMLELEWEVVRLEERDARAVIELVERVQRTSRATGLRDAQVECVHQRQTQKVFVEHARLFGVAAAVSAVV
jgi:uncharacterized membrane protein YphA (DoxX/SURF4 family)